MIDTAALQTAMAPVRELVRADGGDLVVVAVDGDRARLALVLEGAECRECVMPRSFLEQVAYDMMKPTLPALGGVEIADPREGDP